MKYRIAIVLLTMLLFVNLASAQEAFLATEVNYADASVASVAASKVGAPVFFVPPAELPSDVLQALQENNVSTVYIIGGPAVISENVESQLADYEVIRIWGMTRYGTSAEVAKYFWPEGTSEAVIVSDLPDEANVSEDYAELVSKAAELAADDNIPLLLNPTDKLSSEVLEALQTLNVEEVILVGYFSPSVEEEIINNNISIDEVITGSKEDIEEIIERKILESPDVIAKPLIIAAVGGWEDVIYAKAAPKGVSLLVRNESEIPETINKTLSILTTRNVSKILIVGKPDLAAQVYDALIQTEASNLTDIILLTGRKHEKIREMVKEIREHVEELRELHKELREAMEEAMFTRLARVDERCDYWYELANNLASRLPPQIDQLVERRLQIINESYQLCKQAVQQNQSVRAFEILQELRHDVKFLIWKFKGEELRDLFEEELEYEVKSPREIRARVIEKGEEFVSKILEKVEEDREECREIVREYRRALIEGDFEEARELKMKIVKKCRAFPISIKPMSEEAKEMFPIERFPMRERIERD